MGMCSIRRQLFPSATAEPKRATGQLLSPAHTAAPALPGRQHRELGCLDTSCFQLASGSLKGALAPFAL